MSVFYSLLIPVLFSYLIGSIPVGLLLGKTQGKDIRRLGSGNIGATNVLRCLGKPLGIACFILDVLKGFVPAFFFWRIVGGISPDFGILFGAAAIIGHNFPVFLKFKGGKGVATSAGVLLGVAPLAVVIGLVTWIIAFKLSGYVSLGSIIAAIAVVIASWVHPNYTLAVQIALTLLGALSIWRHRSNIVRLKNGTENRFKKGTKASGTEAQSL
ncbi:MAG: glycerol-3-phosphate 1-O-acyltransferase PlsY [Kiritimatiellales bacterium]